MQLVDVRILALGVPVFWVLGSVAAVMSRRDVVAAWRMAHAAAICAAGCAALTTAARVWELLAAAGPRSRSLAPLVAVDFLACAMLALIATLGWVIVSFSRRYLEGEPNQPRYIAALLATLAFASLVALSNQLVMLALGWVATSLSLHRLLIHYPHRQWALMAAHKKFLVSRLAELCLAGVLLLVMWQVGTLSIPALAAAVGDKATLAWPLQAAAALLALAVVLKSAQLPMHGWLIQVMEAPTPVSALLHAGVVNLGGVVLIRLAPLMSAVPLAQAILVIVGGTTAALAGLVMTTRISIKVKLAWSTCAQMGFMLVECGLGMYELALLHLLAHSVYKAHAFLTAAGAVATTRLQRLAPTAGPLPAKARWAGAAAGVALVGASGWVWSQVTPEASVPWAFLLIAGLGLAPLASRSGAGRGSLARAALLPVALAQLPALWHLLLSGTHLTSARPASDALSASTAAGAVVLFAVQSAVSANPRGWLSDRLYHWCYAGFYLDERFTRWTFRVWPPRMPVSAWTEPVPTELVAASGGAR